MCNEKLIPAISLENDLLEQVSKQNDEDKLYADLTGLYTDIIRTIAKSNSDKSLIIYDYAKLLQQELQLFTSAEAYIVGAGSKDLPADDAIADYLCKISQKNNSLGLDGKILALYNEIFSLLGDSAGLIEDFTHTYKLVHGVVKNNIQIFIHLGQKTDMGETA